MTNLLKGHEDFIVSHTRENIRQICADNEGQQNDRINQGKIKQNP